MNRRRFLKYAAGTGVAVGASALGLEYLATRPAIQSQQALTTLNQTTTTSSIAMLPTITGLTYQPTKIVNSKVYDIRVNIELSNPARSLFPVTITLQPVLYSLLPDEAFQKEQPQTYGLQTTGLGTEVLSTIFADLKGGREYDVKAQITSPATDERTIRTEYVREFENIAALDDTTVIADYYTWYEKPSDPGNSWRTDVNGPSQHVYMPLLGEYASGDPIVISKHIDWATGHGIDAFCISWWTTGSDERTWDYHNTKNLDAFLKNPLAKDIQFCILYENSNGRMKNENKEDQPSNWIEDFDDQFNRKRLSDDFTLFADSYFGHQNYLKGNGKCYVRFDFTLPFRGDFVSAFSDARELPLKKGYEMSLACDLMGRSASPYPKNPNMATDGTLFDENFFRHLLSVFDVVAASNFPGAFDEVEKDTQFVEGVYIAWRDFAKTLGKDFIPAVWPGHKGAPPLYVPPYVPLQRSPERLGRQIKLARQYSTAKMFSIISFNEWINGHQIEPSTEEGFAYLDAVRDNI